MKARAIAIGSMALVMCAALAPASVAAARRIRPLFEPTDLDLEDPGVLELDLQFGMARGEDAWRLVVPDFELDLGLWDFLELDIDSAYAIEGRNSASFSFDHPAPDSLWIAAKLGLFDSRDDGEQSAFALGLQIGPKIPTAPAAHGVGAEALILAGTNLKRTHLVWNAGGFIDPAPDRNSARPGGLEVGVDAQIDLDAAGHVSVIGSLAYVHFLSSDADQLVTTLGMNWAVVDALELSLVGLVGVLAGGDRFAILFGVTPKLKLFG
jgi:hypothetical protein